jgi:hypothetical protein
MQMESFLTGKSFSIDCNINAKAMDTHGAKVGKTLMDAQKKKKKMTVRLRPISKNVTLAVITRAYMEDGGHRVVEVPWSWAPRIAVYVGSAACRCTARFQFDRTFGGLEIRSSDMA